MKYFQEVTDWGNHNIPNHIYYLKDDKSRMVGYIKHGTKKLFKFKSPIAIETRGRKFVELKDRKTEPDSAYFAKPVEETKPINSIQVTGSNGKIYTLVKQPNGNYSCSCPGYMFRHKCKHVDELSGKT